MSAGPGASVSVVMLSYNRPAYLRRALESVLAQSHRPAEIIVVDSRSPGSDEVARVVKSSCPQCRLIQMPRNAGFAGGMNRGLRACRGEWVLLTEDDLLLE